MSSCGPADIPGEDLKGEIRIDALLQQRESLPDVLGPLLRTEPIKQCGEFGDEMRVRSRGAAMAERCRYTRTSPELRP